MWVTVGSQKLCLRLGGHCVKADSCCVIRVGRLAVTLESKPVPDFLRVLPLGQLLSGFCLRVCPTPPVLLFATPHTDSSFLISCWQISVFSHCHSPPTPSNSLSQTQDRFRTAGFPVAFQPSPSCPHASPAPSFPNLVSRF